MRVEPLPNLPFGCVVHDLQLADGLSDAEFAQLDAAFHAYGVVVLRGQVGLHPRHEVALARRLEQVWCDRPATIEEREPSPANLRGCNPPGFPEVAVLGNGPVSDHFGLTGKISVAGPLNWHEEASLGWHPDGAYDGREENVLTLFSCYASPSDPAGAGTGRSSVPIGTARWPQPDAGSAKDGTAVLEFPAGSTVFASTTHAFDLCTPAEQETLRTLQVRYYDSPTAMARRKRDLYPIMDPAGIRPLYPPPGPEQECEMSFTDAGFEADGSTASVAGGGLPEYSRADGVSATEELMPVEPLVYVTRTGRESVRCHTVGMRRLEVRAQSLLARDDGKKGKQLHNIWGWEESQALVARVLGRATLPESILVHDWRAGDVLLADNRCVLHSATPSDVFADQTVEMEDQGQRLIHRISLPSPLSALAELKEAGDGATTTKARI